MGKTDTTAHSAMADRVADILEQAKAIESAPILSKAALAQKAVVDMLGVLHDMAAALDNLTGGANGKS